MWGLRRRRRSHSRRRWSQQHREDHTALHTPEPQSLESTACWGGRQRHVPRQLLAGQLLGRPRPGPWNPGSTRTSMFMRGMLLGKSCCLSLSSVSVNRDRKHIPQAHKPEMRPKMDEGGTE